MNTQHTLTRTFASLLPVAIFSFALLLTAQPCFAMQSARPPQPAASKPLSSNMSSASARASMESGYRKGQLVDLSRSTSGATSASASAPAARSAASAAPRLPAHGSAAPAFAGLSTYGSGIGGDALGNTAIGGPVGAQKCFIRFRAEQSSRITSVTIPYLGSDYPGYGGGNGGLWTLKLYADDGSPNHFPTGAALLTKQVDAQSTSSAAKTISLTSNYSTTAGKIYHLVIENVDRAPKINFFSINNWVRLSFTEGGPLNPRSSDADWGTGFYHAGIWRNLAAACPIADIAYLNGAHQGMCYGEASYCCPAGQGACSQEQLVGEINGPTKMVRQRITVSGGDRSVDGFGVRLLRTSATTSDLIVTLRNEFDEEIDSAIIPASTVAIGPAPSYSVPASWHDLGQNARWVTATFNDVHTLSDGATYYLELSSDHGTYWAWVMRRMSAEYAYSPQTAFTDGWAEFTINGLTWDSLGRVRHQSDLQFYFTVE